MVRPSGGLWDRVDAPVADDEPLVLVAGRRPVVEVVARFEAGEAPADIGVEADDLVTALAIEVLGGDGPPLVRSEPRRPRLAAILGEEGVARLYPHASRPAQLGLATGLLQIHDFWDASHDAAQRADDLGERSVSNYWHGIAHRREPDPGNASYWFRKVGRHPVFLRLAELGRPALAWGNPPIGDRLLPGGLWDTFAFINFCQTSSADAALIARRLQRLEMMALLEASIPS